MLCACGRRFHRVICSGVTVPARTDLGCRYVCPVCRFRERPQASAPASEVACQLRTQGFCVLRGVLPADTLVHCLQESVDFFAAATRSHERLHAASTPGDPPRRSKRRRGSDPEYSNFKQRSPNRFDMTPPRFECDDGAPPTASWSQDWCPDLALSVAPAWLSVVAEVLGDDFQPMARGVMLSRAGAAEQEWHTDGPSLCLDTESALPAHALNVFVPLVPVDSSNGTALVPGSHLVVNPDDDDATGCGAGSPAGATTPQLDAGDVLVFDYRTLHRGEANTTAADRPVVYLSYSVPWFRDVANFNTAQYRRKLEVG